LAGAITVGEGKDWTAAGWAHDAVIALVGDALPEKAESLRKWLHHGLTPDRGGMGYLDLSELAPKDRDQVIVAIHNAFRVANERGPVGWQDASFFPGWLTKFRELVEMTQKELPPNL
jgi:hypothetical protein